MASKRRGPVLLELLKDRSPSGPQRTPPPAVAPPPPAPPPPVSRPSPAPKPVPVDSGARPWWMSPGRVVRIPVGYLFFAAAGVVALFALGWTLGHRQAVVSHRTVLAAEAEETLGASHDPLLSEPTSRPSNVRQQTVQAQTPTTRTTQPQSSQTAEQAPRTRPGQPGDPRTPGLNYYIVVRESPETAERAASFLRNNGLAAVTIPDNNPRFHNVVVLKGFAREDLGSEERRRLHQEILRLGKIWKRDHGGASEFSDLWLKRHDP